MARPMNPLLVTLLLNTLYFHPLLSFFTPASQQEQNERGRRVLLALAKEIVRISLIKATKTLLIPAQY